MSKNSAIIPFDFSKDYILEDDFVLLRPLDPNDFNHLLTFALNEPEIWKYSLLSGAGEEGLKNYITQAVEARQALKEYPFIVYDKINQSYAGSTRFYDIQLAYHTVQLGYTWYGKKFQGTRVNKHCKFLLFTFAFEQMSFERVELRADNRNTRSKAAMQSIGCTVEGVLRRHMPAPEGGRRDSIVLSILDDEWKDSVKEMLRGKL
ncbi:MAG: GNAT family N-acetyltransferase [Saprospiraceae bacterium]|jgi:RimJ/RimL family protein N-acetyltransferase|nr:GNAT family N-acetyltransferase [Saprospiraceae bacterium]